MAFMKNPKERIEMMALKEASAEMPMDAEQGLNETCTCPKCGHTASEEEFKKEDY